MSKSLMKNKNDVVVQVEDEVQQLTKKNSLDLPPNYSVGNALNAAWLELQNTKTKGGKNALEYCNDNTIKRALLDMTIQGLNPAKKQCYLLPYGKTLTCQPSYLGNVMIAKRQPEVEDIVARIIYKEDEFEYHIEDGDIVIDKHSQKFGNRKESDAIGAYATVKFTNKDRKDYVEIMNLDEIKNAWKQGSVYGNSKINEKKKVHNKFKCEMMKKTVTSRAAKHYINTTDDSNLAVEAYNRQQQMQAEAGAAEEIKENANTVDFEDAIEPEEVKEPETTDNTKFLEKIEELKSDVPEPDYKELLEKFGVEKENYITDREEQLKFYDELKELVEYYKE